MSRMIEATTRSGYGGSHRVFMNPANVNYIRDNKEVRNDNRICS